MKPYVYRDQRMKLLCTLLTILITNQYRVLCRTNHNRDRKFSWNNVESEYRETIPIRVDEAGQSVYSQDKQFLSYINRVPDSELLYYHVIAFERTFKFKLVRDRSFVSPGLQVEHVFNDSVSIPYRGELGHCFYHGRLEEDSLSTVLFNLCNGLRGSFTTKGIEYFIDHTEEDEEERRNSSSRGKIHVVYRRRENARSTNTSYDLGETYFPENSSEYVIDLNQDELRISRKKRSQRYYIDAAYLETMITADRSMVEAFSNKAELQSYLITIMGMVARIYRDRSIGNLIKVVLVKIYMLESDLSDLHVSSSATNSLTSFCNWQKKMNKPSDSNPGHYDTAILITKRDICRAAGKCDTLGLAQLSTVCSTSRSCAIVEDSGLNTAFTVAHELAHVFSVAHDGDRNICTKQKDTSNIMAPSLSFETKPWMWSPCSRRALTEFLELGYGWCLEDRPDERGQTFYEERLPGEKYTANEQCRFIFGSQSRLCPAMEPCRRLWCVKQIGKQKGCQTHHMPWADGTPCGKDKWCIRGVCVKQRRLQPIDGQWGQWSSFGSCSRSCGGGIRFSYRRCDNPTPENGGFYCHGAHKKFESCNTQDCPDTIDFRAIQCARHNKRMKIKGYLRKVNLVPKYAGVRKEERCSLFCRVSGEAIYFRVKKKVEDGTTCNQYSSDVCVDGQCRSAGCDRVVGSNARFDLCAVCKGDNSTCRKYNARYNKKTKYGYNFIYDIPVGSTNIRITQQGRKPEDDNFLALKSNKKNKYLLNGGYVVGLGVREFVYNGAKVWYSGSEKKIEEIRISGKTTEAIKVEVLAVGSLDLPNIEYSLYIPFTGRRKQRFAWHANGPWTQCSRICKGRRRRQIMCRRQSDNRVVSNRRCKRYPRPAAIKEPCNTNCRLRWNVKSEQCSVRCGSGTQPQKVRCMRVSGRRMEIIPDEYCKHLSRPPDSVPCKGECKDSKWIYSDWSECSKSCGAGVQRRTVNCIDVGGGYLPDNDCRESDKQPLQQPCNDQKCPTWSAGRWSSCSATCGKGLENRQVSCNNGEKAFPDSACRSGVKPSTTRSCSPDACPNWSTTAWSECSVSCGKGVQTRQVNCRNTKKVFSESACRSQAKPPVKKPCSHGKCPYWITTGWSKCSVTCGSGRKTRQVSCHYPMNNSVVSKIPCNPAAKPMDNKHCFKRECPPVPTKPRYSGSWSEGEWSQCSVTCDKGIKRRRVLCRDSRGLVIPDFNCNEEEKPQQETSCLAKPCTSWKHGQWGLCSKPCGQGIQLRIVKCAFDNWEIADDTRCDPSKKPPDYRPCNIRSCHPRPVLNIPRVFTSTDSLDSQPTTPFSPRWEVKEWSPCSVTCGKGVRNRAVTCKLRNNQRSSLCSPQTKPQTTFVCNLGPCPKWIAQPWSQCSKSCGSGKRYRIVKCNGGNTKCDNNTKPPETEVCNIQKCPEWIIGSWSKCSVTCGKGYQLRSVSCSTRNGNCNRSNKPSQIRSCKYVQCPKWKLGIWSECTVTCGKGLQIRNVTCGSNTLPCDTRHKPTERRVCNTKKCSVWRAGSWSKCSTTCGGGMRLRPVTCHPIRGQCNPQTKPRDSEQCNMEECPRWIVGSWNECSVSCGGGVTKRKVRCNNKRIPVLCDASKKPSTTTSCNIHHCPKWTFSRWSKCSVTCGAGVETRNVTCLSKQGQQCDSRIKPQRTRVCNTGRCPSWITGRWSQCSKTCGDGFQLRKVDCDDVRGSCNISQRPLVTKKCNLGACPEWRVGNWSHCSVSCGEGVKSRGVMCSTGDDKCRTLPKPKATKKCVLSMCPSWVVGVWSKCSTTCDEGLQKREVTCKPASGRCDRRIKPEGSRICNLGLCPKWDPGTWSECSVSCGEGVRRRVIRCNSNLFPCRNETRPIHMERCNLGLCPKWSVGHWSICSVSCGDGIQIRDVQCSTGDDRCVAKKPSTKRSCNLGQCPKWVVGPWEYCSVTCGLGVKKRIVYCNTRDDRCDQNVKPTSSQNCKMTDCPSWSAGPWSQCSVTCGPGMRIRRLQCISTQDNVCNAETKPAETEKCHKGPCPKWLTNDWSKCSVTCGMGFQTRSVICSDQKRKCNPDRKPLVILRCDRGECPAWTVGPWDECSTTCGDGIQRRGVICRAGGKPALCDENSKPTGIRECNRMECPVWTVGLWSECSKTCGDGIKRRPVICRSGDKLATCEESTKPAATERCNRMECPVWIVGLWSECSTTCGDGEQRRDVSCRKETPATCDENTKPIETRKCNRTGCPVWTAGLWSECSATCGEAVQKREVICISTSGKFKCNERSKPISVRPCKLEVCPVWITGNWSECSVTCGKGTSTREVQCNSQPNKCKKESKPARVKSCHRGACPNWVVGPWSQCSVTCSKGKMKRSVNCTLPNKCDEETKPSTDVICNMGSCARWRTGEWSQCSVSCGQGRKTRTVRCMDGDRPSYECTIETRPSSFSSCGSDQDCPSWTAGNWTQCSRSCGIGVASRLVRCLQGSQVLDFSSCDARKRPVIRRACQIQECVRGAFWGRGPWGKCSEHCSEGVKTRKIQCVARNRTQIEDKYCDRRKVPQTTKSCNKYKECGEWEVGPWSKCSTSCGDGLKTRAVRCLHNLEYTREDNCDLSKKPIDQLFCQNNICPLSSAVFRWQKTSWSKCSRTCGYGRKARRVMCVDNNGNKVNDIYCNTKAKPDQFLPCFEVRCPPKWKFGDWSECSRTCGHGGYQVRPVTCEGVPGAGGCNVRNKPPVWRPCNFGPCSGEFKWKVGSWSQCSVSCGIGVMKRDVHCYDKQERRRPDSFCTLPALKPDETRPCHMIPCTPRTCREIQITSGLQADGEHVLEIQGRLLKIYCHGMTTDNPKEYITLKSGTKDNFAEIYPMRLLNPYRCPRNRSTESCPCEPGSYEESGGAYFSKIRFDINNMVVIADDMEFAVTRGLKPPLYGTAGDCYSLVNCPQGRFSINLQGTGLELSPEVRWVKSGRSASQVIYRYPEGQQVIGKCGGYCGKCRPDERVGLKLTVSKGN